MPRCVICHRRFTEPAGEQGEHDCPHCGGNPDAVVTRMEHCEHPASHRRHSPGLIEDDSCRVCGAMSWTIRRQAALRREGVF